jgi:hypothetical protein
MLRRILSAAAISAVVVMTSTFSASAAIVCQRNTCWHTHDAYDFPHEAGVVVHEDNWHWGPHEKFMFRETRGPRLLARRQMGDVVILVTPRMTGGRRLAASFFHSRPAPSDRALADPDHALTTSSSAKVLLAHYVGGESR